MQALVISPLFSLKLAIISEEEKRRQSFDFQKIIILIYVSDLEECPWQFLSKRFRRRTFPFLPSVKRGSPGAAVALGH